MEINEKIAQFNKTNSSVFVSYGGDGTLLNAVHDNPKKVILPIRDYGNCEAHDSEKLVDLICKESRKPSGNLKVTVFPTIQYSYRDEHGELRSKWALSEIAVKNVNISEALRFDVIVNGHVYLDNVICDGVVMSTPYGSHGYFKSVSRMLFYDGLGLAFIAPTYGICNLVLKQTDKVFVRFRRDSEILVSADKDISTMNVKTGDLLILEDACSGVSIAGYANFMCSECRKNRNSTILNDQYFV